jgi:hypothetical protein
VIMVVLGRRGTGDGDAHHHEGAQQRPDTSHH